MKKCKIVLSIAIITHIFISIINLPSCLGTSIGVSPGKLYFNELSFGGKAEQTITLSTASEKEIEVNFEIMGNEKDWISFEPKNTKILISISKPYTLKIIAEPKKATMGEYDLFLKFIAKEPHVTGKYQTAINTGIISPIHIKITDGINIDCQAGGLSFIKNQEDIPPSFIITLKNQGDKGFRPQIKIDIWDGKKKFLFSEIIKSEEALAHQEKKFNISLSNILKQGNYFADISIKECGFSEQYGLTILKTNSSSTGELYKIETINSKINEPIPIKAFFINNGEKETSAYFLAEIFFNGTKISELKSDEIKVEKNKQTEFIVYYSSRKMGTFSVLGKVIFNNKQTNEIGSTFFIEDQKINTNKKFSSKNAIMPVIIILIALTIIFLFMIIKKEKYIN